MGETTRRIRRLGWEPDPQRAEFDAERILDDVYDEQEWFEDLVKHVASPLATTFALGGLTEVELHDAARQKQTSAEAIAARLNISVPAEIAVGRMPDWLLEAARNELADTFAEPYWQRIPSATRDDIKRTLVLGIEEGLSMRKVAKLIADNNGPSYSRRRGMLVARTECLVANTTIDGAEITAAYKREYSGDLIELVTDSGSKITGTPNHPMLTTRGWVALGDLQESDTLIGYDIDVKDESTSRDKHIDAVPATISKIFDSLSAIAVTSRERTGKPDFHGDGLDGYVDVLRTDRPLRYGLKPTLTKNLVKHALKPSELCTVLLTAKSNTFSKTVPASITSRLVAISHVSTESFNNSIDAFSNDSIFLSDCRNRHVGDIVSENVSLREVFAERAITSGEQYFTRFRQRPNNSCTKQSSSYGIRSNIHLLGNLPIRKPRQIKLHRISRLRVIKNISCHVFNLSTVDGYFIANGLCTGNTTGMLNAGHVAGIEQLQKDEPEMEMGVEWLSVLGNTTRSSHAAMDGAERRLKETFLLGGVDITHPGDRRLPAEERCNCQCSVLSTFIMDELAKDDPEDAEREPDKWAGMPAEQLANSHPGLEKKRKKVLKIPRDIELERAKLTEQINAMDDELERLKFEQQQMMEAHRRGEGDRSAVLDMLQQTRRLDSQVGELMDKRRMLRQKTRDRVLAAISVPTKQRGKWKVTKSKSSDSRDRQVSTGKYTKQYNDKLSEARKFITRVTNADGVEQGVQEARAHISAQKRAFYRGTPGSHIAERSTRLGLFMSENEATSTFVHEYGHHLENSIPGVQARANEFLDYRIAKHNRPTVKFKDVLPGYGYRANEEGNEDGFGPLFDKEFDAEAPSASIGKNLNEALYTGKHYRKLGVADTEIVSMGIEKLYEDPVVFAERDPEYFKFVVGILDGTIR